MDLNKCRECGREINNPSNTPIICRNCIPKVTGKSHVEYFNNIMAEHMISIKGEDMSVREAFELYKKMIACCCYYSEIIMGNDNMESLNKSIECINDFIGIGK